MLFGEHEDSQSDDPSNQNDSENVLETNKPPFCIQLMIVYVFQHKSDVFRVVDGVIFYF